jgi:hypothetical protein
MDARVETAARVADIAPFHVVEVRAAIADGGIFPTSAPELRALREAIARLPRFLNG